MTKLYSDKVIQNDKLYNEKRLHNYIVIIRQMKKYDICKQGWQSEYYSRIYTSNAVGRRRALVGRPEPEAG